METVVAKGSDMFLLSSAKDELVIKILQASTYQDAFKEAESVNKGNVSMFTMSETATPMTSDGRCLVFSFSHPRHNVLLTLASLSDNADPRSFLCVEACVATKTLLQYFSRYRVMYLNRGQFVKAWNFNPIGPSFCPYSVGTILKRLNKYIRVGTLMKQEEVKRETLLDAVDVSATIHVNRIVLYYFWVLHKYRKVPTLLYVRKLTKNYDYTKPSMFRAVNREKRVVGGIEDEASDIFVFRYLLGATTTSDLANRFLSISVETVWSTSFEVASSELTLI